MTKKIVYALGTKVRLKSQGDQTNNEHGSMSYPKRTRLLLAKMEMARGNPQQQLQVLSELGDLFTETEDWGKVIHYGNKELKLAKSLHENPQILGCLSRMVQACRSCGEYTAAVTYNSEYVKFAKLSHDKSELLDAHLEMAVSLMKRGEFESDSAETDFSLAEESLRNAVQLLGGLDLPEIDKKRIRAQIYMNSGIIFKAMGDPDKGINMIRRALTFYQSVRDLPEQANAMCNLAYCYDVKEEHLPAIKFGEMERAIHAQMNNTPGEIMSMWDNVTRFRKMLDFGSAINLIQTICDKWKSLGDMEEHRRAVTSLQECKNDQEQFKKMLALESEISKAQMRQDLRTEFRIRGEMAEIAMSLLANRIAVKELQRQREIALHLKFGKVQLIPVLMNLGDMLFQTHRYNDAVATYRELLQDFVGPAEKKALALEQLGYSIEKAGNSSKSLIANTFDQAYRAAEMTTEYDLQRRILKKLIVAYHQAGQREKSKITEGILQRLNRLHPAEDNTITQDSEDLSEESDTEDNESRMDKLPSSKTIPSPLLNPGHFDAHIVKHQPNVIELDIESSNDAELIPTKRNSPPQCTSESRARRLRVESSSPTPSPSEEENDQSIKRRAQSCDEYDEESDSELPPASTVLNPKKALVKNTNKPSPINLHKTRKLEVAKDQHSISVGRSPVTTSYKHEPLKTPQSDSRTKHESVTMKLIGIADMNAHSPAKTMTGNSPAMSNKSNTPTRLKTPVSVTRRRDNIPSSKKLRIRVQIESEEDKSNDVFVIPCETGMNGTPKTFRWLLDETTRRYRQMYKSTPRIRKLVLKDSEHDENQILFEQDVISQVVDDNAKVYALIDE